MSASLEGLEGLRDLLDRAWEKELAIIFADIANDLELGHITVEQAIQRMESIPKW